MFVFINSFYTLNYCHLLTLTDMYEHFGVWKYSNKAGVSQKVAAKTQVVVTGNTAQHNTLQHFKGREQKYTEMVIHGVTETQRMAK